MNNFFTTIFGILALKNISNLLEPTESCVKQPGKLPEYLLGEDNIKVGERFYGYSCTVLFEDQVCTKVDNDLVYGTTTLAVFNKKFIKKY